MSQQSSDQRESTGLSTAPGEVTWPPDLSGDSLRPDTTIGNYRLIEQVGAGGMGVVYRAEQIKPVRRIVALKLVKLGMDTRDVVARFESERQALAVLEHPGIARVYDAGATQSGRPYFVMEFVAGVPITQYCDERGLATRRRLELFELVCHAVQHAHFKGILHRDLKPSNILVTEVDGAPQAKVIDFGVAKAVRAEGVSDPRATVAGQLVGTPAYMSPEQAGGDADVDTRADVYSLGVVLYELLCGAPPIDPASLRGHDTARIASHIREVQPLRPSARATSTERQRELRGDLDRIALKAVHKDRAHRYDTAAALAEDVRRHLSNEPIRARPPTLAYQARKFARRNRVLVAASVMVLAAVIAGAIAATVGMVRARRALAREAAALAQARTNLAVAENVSGFLGDMLSSVDPQFSGGAPVLVRDVLDRASKDLPARFDDQPIVKAALHDIIASTYHGLGQYPEALAHAQAALELRRRARGANDPNVLEAMGSVAALLESNGRISEAEAMRRDLLARARAVHGPEHRFTATAEDTLAVILLDTDRAAEAEPLARHALDLRKKALGDDDPETLTSLHNLASIAKALARLDEAEQLGRAAADGRARVLGPDKPLTLLSKMNLGATLLAQKRLDDAQPVLRDTLARCERVMGPEHPRTLVCLNNLAATVLAIKRMDEAEALFRAGMERRRRSLGPNHPDTLIAVGNLAHVLEQRQKLDDALPLYEEVYAKSRGADVTPSRKARYAAGYGLCLVKLQRYVEAEQPLLESHLHFESANMPRDKRMRDVVRALADVAEHTGRSDEAARWRAESDKLN
jgi:non-specific serine/threonine protein kinase/serine/threonine-protein kinase